VCIITRGTSYKVIPFTKLRPFTISAYDPGNRTQQQLDDKAQSCDYDNEIKSGTPEPFRMGGVTESCV